MLFSDLYKETLISVTANKARSGLTILGIVIGIASVIAMISIGQGAQKSIESSIQSIGSNLLIITPGAQRGVGGGGISSGMGSAQTLTIEDSAAIKDQVSLIAGIAPEIAKRYQITNKSLNTNTTVTGTVADYAKVRSIDIDSGVFISETDNKSFNKVAVIGPTTRDDLFGSSTDSIGKTIRIKQIDFKVIGVTKSKGSSGFGSRDDMVFIPIQVAQKYLSGNADNVSSISIQAQDPESLTAVQNQVTDLLLLRHKISNPSQADFQVMNQADIVATASTVTGTFTMLLAAIAGISLIVGGIGIMNMMLTNVTERTREIGLRKAIGAQKKDISNQFLFESIILTFFGGVIGIFLGWLIALAISKFAGIATNISLYSIMLAFGVSAFIGIVFGYYPAKRAARLDPIEALRYE